ncbi:hypothetical protein SAMN02745166_03888 [Prosthecobacter debontii]|uniref:Uncharacterized protein n=2 Tax=Prosthecobacter debontii TaxID=48467 RepID=A0A1T4YQ51_9BACT|nr:hypothetical protein SAMN02745166_03888 [Prosthecobacter debontii]
MLVQPGCGLFKKKKKPEEAPKTVLVGIVEMVSPEQNYVLIRCDRLPDLPAAAELIALDATGVESKLKLTPERKGRYLTADITQGQPRVANLVIFKRSGSAPPVTPTVPPAGPSSTPAFSPDMPMPLLPVTGLPDTSAVPAGALPSTAPSSVPGQAPGLPPPMSPAPLGGQSPVMDLEPPVQ